MVLKSKGCIELRRPARQQMNPPEARSERVGFRHEGFARAYLKY
jgi:hypothetical protein